MFMGYGNTMQASVDRDVALEKSRAQLRYYKGLGRGNNSSSSSSSSDGGGGSGGSGGGDYSKKTNSSSSSGSSSSSKKNSSTKTDQSVVGQSSTDSGSTYGDTVTTDKTVDTDYKFEDVGDVTDPNNVRGFQRMGTDGQRKLSHMDRHGGPRRIGDSVRTRGVVGTEGFTNAFSDTDTNQQTKSNIATNTSASAKQDAWEKSNSSTSGTNPASAQSMFGSLGSGITGSRRSPSRSYSSSRSNSPQSYASAFGGSGLTGFNNNTGGTHNLGSSSSGGGGMGSSSPQASARTRMNNVSGLNAMRSRL